MTLITTGIFEKKTENENRQIHNFFKSFNELHQLRQAGKASL
jgi:hypothetical protein